MNLKQLRKSCLLTQGDVQGETGIEQATLSKIENGVHSPQIPTLRKLAECYDVDYKVLLEALAETRERSVKA